MKKKHFALFSLALATTTLFAIGGCSKEKDPTLDNTPTERPLTWTIADFETWETGIQLARTWLDFGAIRENTDTQYVHSGQKSALLHPLGGYRSGKNPIIFWPTYSEKYEYDNRDFTDAQKITYEMYNAEDEAVPVAVGLILEATTGAYKSTAIKYQDLAPKQWTTVTYEVNTSVLSIDVDITKIEGVYIAFENQLSRDEADAPDIYVDDIVLHRYEKAPELNDMVSLDEMEFLDFEKPWQEYILGTRQTDCAPVSTIVKASEQKIGPAPENGQADNRETLSAISGDNVLKVHAPANQTGTTFWPGLAFSSAVTDASLLARLDKKDYGITYFTMSVFNNSPIKQNFGLLFTNAKGNKYWQYNMMPEPYEWFTFTVNLKQLYEDWQTKYPNNTEVLDTPGAVEIVWTSFDGEDREYFFDNFHFTQDTRDTTVKPEIHVTSFVREASVGSTIDFPSASAHDRYDLDVPITMEQFYKDGNEWKPLTLEKGKIVVDHVGEYKIVVKAKNSLGNEAVVECPFVGVEKARSNVWSTYSYADQVSEIYMPNGSSGAGNKVEWMESATFNGETRNGVVKVTTDNADQWKSGVIGFEISKQLLDVATVAEWDYFLVDICIDAVTDNVNIDSSNIHLYKSVPTHKWIQLKITKDVLNLEFNPGAKTTINTTGAPLEDKVFYSYFNEVCGTDTQDLFFTTTIDTQSHSGDDLIVTYYIDEITWGKDIATSYGDGDDGVLDIYGDEWADPFRKQD